MIVDGELRGSVAVLHDISEIKRLTYELDQAKQIIRKLEAKYTFDDIIGEDEHLRLAIENARKAALTPATIMLRGESGTGKELFAHAIHDASNRKYRQFVRVNCAAISENLLESELFGYEEGAFTGARKGGKKGLFEQANGGTIFLDEIGEISLNTQAKLLRVLQEKEFVRVGGNIPINIDVRVIAATNLDLERAIREGKFREDLYYRLNVVPIIIPPLRHRRKDIPLLAHHLIKKFNQEYGRYVQGISPNALEKLMQLDWQGNVRELENFIGRAIINMKFNETIIKVNHLPVMETQAEGKAIDCSIEDDKQRIANKTLEEVVEEAERKYILTVLKEKKNNRTETAKHLGISIRSLYYKLNRYNIV
jgi:transcriptional regulator with PAS, ATPase and Fis domain